MSIDASDVRRIRSLHDLDGPDIDEVDALKGPPGPAYGDAGVAPQAHTIIAKFGGPSRLARLMSRHLDRTVARSTIYRWTYSKARHGKSGTNGIIPTSALNLILEIARKEGIFITSDDLYPGRR